MSDKADNGRRRGKLVSSPVSTTLGSPPDVAKAAVDAEALRNLVGTPGEIKDEAEQMAAWYASLPPEPDDAAADQPEVPLNDYMNGLRGALTARVAQTVNYDRQAVYGPPEDGLATVAGLWSTYLGVEVTAPDAAALLVLLKVARIQVNPFHTDSWLDLMGYGLIGGGIAAFTLENQPEGGFPYSQTEDMGS
jgi:hypothetical protein